MAPEESGPPDSRVTPEPGAREVHLWTADPADPALPFDLYLTWLSPDERARSDRFAAEVHRREYLVTRALVRSVLSEYRPSPPESWRFAANEYGKPRTDPETGLHFNLSNSPGLVVCAVAADGPLGVDVEPVHRAGLIAEVADTVFSSQERADLAELPEADRPGRHLDLWTLKEAYLKARGLGLSLPLQGFSWRFGPAGDLRLELSPELGDRPDHWWFGRFRRQDHRGALVGPGPGPVRLKQFGIRPAVSEALLLSDRVLPRGTDF